MHPRRNLTKDGKSARGIDIITSKGNGTGRPPGVSLDNFPVSKYVTVALSSPFKEC